MGEEKNDSFIPGKKNNANGRRFKVICKDVCYLPILWHSCCVLGYFSSNMDADFNRHIFATMYVCSCLIVHDKDLSLCNLSLLRGLYTHFCNLFPLENPERNLISHRN